MLLKQSQSSSSSLFLFRDSFSRATPLSRSLASSIYVLDVRSSPFQPPSPLIFPRVRACLYPGYALASNLKLLCTFKPTCLAKSRTFHNVYGSPSKIVMIIEPFEVSSGRADLKKPTRSSRPNQSKPRVISPKSLSCRATYPDYV